MLNFLPFTGITPHSVSSFLYSPTNMDTQALAGWPGHRVLDDPCFSNPFPPPPAPPWASFLPPTIPGECSVEWMAPDRGLRGWNVSLALQGSHPPEHWRTAQSLLINHCQGCPGPGPNNHLVQPPFFYPLSHAYPHNSYTCIFKNTNSSWNRF